MFNELHTLLLILQHLKNKIYTQVKRSSSTHYKWIFGHVHFFSSLETLFNQVFFM